MREAGDLGQAAEQLLAAKAGDREPSLQVVAVVDTLHEIARAEGSGRTSSTCWPAFWRWPLRWRLAICCVW